MYIHTYVHMRVDKTVKCTYVHGIRYKLLGERVGEWNSGGGCRMNSAR